MSEPTTYEAFLQLVKSSVECPICKEVCKQPVRPKGCAHRYCLNCFKQCYKDKKDKSCATCRVSILAITQRGYTQDALFTAIMEKVPGIADDDEEEMDLAAMMKWQQLQTASVRNAAQQLRASDGGSTMYSQRQQTRMRSSVPQQPKSESKQEDLVEEPHENRYEQQVEHKESPHHKSGKDAPGTSHHRLSHSTQDLQQLTDSRKFSALSRTPDLKRSHSPDNAGRVPSESYSVDANTPIKRPRSTPPAPCSPVTEDVSDVNEASEMEPLQDFVGLGILDSSLAAMRMLDSQPRVVQLVFVSQSAPESAHVCKACPWSMRLHDVANLGRADGSLPSDATEFWWLKDSQLSKIDDVNSTVGSLAEQFGEHPVLYYNNASTSMVS